MLQRQRRASEQLRQLNPDLQHSAQYSVFCNCKGHRVRGNVRQALLTYNLAHSRNVICLFFNCVLLPPRQFQEPPRLSLESYSTCYSPTVECHAPRHFLINQRMPKMQMHPVQFVAAPINCDYKNQTTGHLSISKHTQ
jgi:hypothetical protein